MNCYPVKTPKGWKVYELQVLSECIVDCPHSTPKWIDEGIICLRTSNLTEGGWNWDDIRYVTEEDYKTRTSRSEIIPGDIILSREGTVGIAAIVPSGLQVCMGQRLVQIRPKHEVVDSSFLLRVLLWQLAPTRINQLMRGSTSQHLNVRDLRSMSVCLPPIEEQRRIAAILDKADAVRRKRQEAIRLTEELLRSQFLEMFGELSDQDWQITTVEHIAANHKASIRTGPFGSQLLHSEFVDEGIAVLGIDNAVQNQFSWTKSRFITEEKYKQLRRYTVCPEDVIITIMGTCGRCAIIPANYPTAINTKHLCCITLDQTKCIPEFLHSYFLLHPQARQYLKKNAKGAIMDGLNMSIIKNLPIPLAPLNLQKKYKKLSNKINNIKKQSTEFNNSQTYLFNSLLQRAFQGEL